jgi:hypothetical protein
MKETSYNFGAIRDSIMRLSAAEMIKESKSPTLDKFASIVQKNPIFQKQHLFFKNIQECKAFEKERLADRFLNQNLQLFINERWENIIAENKKIRKEFLDNAHVEARKDGKLFEAINVLIEARTRPGFSDFEREQESYEVVMNHLTRPVISESEKSKEKNDSPKLVKDAWKFITKVAVSNFNERFSHLNENEKKVFKILISDFETKRDYFESLRAENIQTINKKITEEKSKNISDLKTIGLLHEFKNKLEKMKGIDFNSIDDGIISCFELKETLNK